MLPQSSFAAVGTVNAPPVPLRPLGWCGWLLPVPAELRPFKIDGDERRGMIGLADKDQPRLILKWTRARCSRRGREKLVRHQLLRGLPRGKARALRGRIEPVAQAQLQPMFRLHDPDGGATRCVAYAAGSGRLIELLFGYGEGRRDDLVRRNSVIELGDQPAGEPGQWAFFDVSFVVPAGMSYAGSSLKVGDMRIGLVSGPNRAWHRASVGIRFIYPASLAMKRGSLQYWMDQLLTEQLREYRVPRARRQSEHRFEPLETLHGDGLSCETCLRPVLRAIRWRTPIPRQNWIIHDQSHNRLIALQATTRRRDLAPAMTTLVEGLHWASRESRVTRRSSRDAHLTPGKHTGGGADLTPWTDSSAGY